MMNEPYPLFILVLLGSLVHGIDFQASSIIGTEVNMTCSVTETNIQAILFIRISVKSPMNEGPGDQLEPRVIALTTSKGIKHAEDLPPRLQSTHIAGHLDDTYFSKSRLTVGFNLTNIPCGYYDAVYTCEIYYLDLKHVSVTVNSNKTLTTMCETAAGQSSDSAVHRSQRGMLLLCYVWIPLLLMW